MAGKRNNDWTMRSSVRAPSPLPLPLPTVESVASLSVDDDGATLSPRHVWIEATTKLAANNMVALHITLFGFMFTVWYGSDRSSPVSPIASLD